MCIAVSELIFEGYNAPSLTYGIDALFSYSYNGGRTGLVVSSGNTATHLIPVIDGKGMIPMTTRLNWGSSQGTELMLKLIQLKYPSFPSKLQNWQAEALVKDHCYVSGDYKAEVETYLTDKALDEKDRVIQFPFTETVVVEKSQEELDKIAEKRKESGRRLQEQAAKARLEKVRYCFSVFPGAFSKILTSSSSKNKSLSISKTLHRKRNPWGNVNSNDC
jgi:actin-related protein 5